MMTIMKFTKSLLFNQRKKLCLLFVVIFLYCLDAFIPPAELPNNNHNEHDDDGPSNKNNNNNNNNNIIDDRLGKIQLFIWIWNLSLNQQIFVSLIVTTIIITFLLLLLVILVKLVYKDNDNYNDDDNKKANSHINNNINNNTKSTTTNTNTNTTNTHHASSSSNVVITASSWDVILGMGLVICGFILRLWSKMILSNFFTYQISIPSQLIQYGPYKYMIHPGYAGAFYHLLGIIMIATNFIYWSLLLSLSSSSCCCGCFIIGDHDGKTTKSTTTTTSNFGSIWKYHITISTTLFAIIFSILHTRLEDEEKMLHDHFGEDWIDHISTRWKLIPFVF